MEITIFILITVLVILHGKFTSVSRELSELKTEVTLKHNLNPSIYMLGVPINLYTDSFTKICRSFGYMERVYGIEIKHGGNTSAKVSIIIIGTEEETDKKIKAIQTKYDLIDNAVQSYQENN